MILFSFNYFFGVIIIAFKKPPNLIQSYFMLSRSEYRSSPSKSFSTYKKRSSFSFGSKVSNRSVVSFSSLISSSAILIQPSVSESSGSCLLPAGKWNGNVFFVFGHYGQVVKGLPHCISGSNHPKTFLPFSSFKLTYNQSPFMLKMGAVCSLLVL